MNHLNSLLKLPKNWNPVPVHVTNKITCCCELNADAFFNLHHITPHCSFTLCILFFKFAVSIQSEKREGEEGRGGAESQGGSGGVLRQIQFIGETNM